MDKAADQAARRAAFHALFKSGEESKSVASKGEFTQALAGLLTPTTRFVVPQYLRQALEWITKTSAKETR
ncbi:hypothetical protein TH66_19180 [Carbonactinospora thermoautotrophica]|uniref:Uncharacterized protein n=1 Tax=Carbonactinospora thermoautotrophica TaxID=1469144 RepID=A0A132MU36_9ACTN|nr:hypothetical protein [Carbonactinospora thermoautotrophica]KWW97664.1 hypothetical protein TH66_19180 [Carbonactinospora thermoautotrophica]KWX00882.1 hypothetical protein LI90_1910 [Carbonactinospora thermoautotrophica]KWX08667.1 hypothetical protein TR74_13935 [Carbonactinospora thermoautotrophica]